MRSRDILISVPTRGDIGILTVMMLQEIREADRNLGPIFYAEGHLSVAESRNKIIDHFLEGKWRTLVMLDDDVCPPPNFLKITDHLDYFDMVGCPVPFFSLKQGGMRYAVFGDDGSILVPRRTSVGVLPVGRIGTGCFSLTRGLVEALGPKPFDVGYDEDGNMESDDIRFCRKVSAAGFKIGCHWDMVCDHFQRFHGLALMGY